MKETSRVVFEAGSSGRSAASIGAELEEAEEEAAEVEGSDTDWPGK